SDSTSDDFSSTPSTNDDAFIHLDAKFSSFEEFRLSMEDWMNRNYQPFRIASSEKLNHCEPTVDDSICYRYLVYHCIHYGNPRKRGEGRRPNQNYLACGCGATIRLKYYDTDKCLKITTFKIEHSNHGLSAKSFAKLQTKL
ncbi:hypothetical protein PENTCL1PPCAC_1579, partial [Pristionchus entomophagus]